MTLQEAKDKAAREYGYRDWKDIYSSFDAGDLSYQILEIVIDDAMEIYASQQRTDGIREGFDAARANKYLYANFNYPTVEDYLNQKKLKR